MNRTVSWSVIGTVITFFVLMLVFAVGCNMGYIWHNVAPNEVGLVLKKNEIQEVVPPGVYTEFGLFLDLVDVSVESLRFCAEDPEIITSDKQRVGLRACGDVVRPGLEAAEDYPQLWATYKTYYSKDEALIGRPNEDGVSTTGLMADLSRQAMKECVGDRTFDSAAIGTSRGDLGDCMGSVLSELADPFGLTVRNVVVPNIIISAQVQADLDRIVASRNAALFAEQEAIRAEEEAKRQLAEEQGRIRVEQGIVQEQRRQEAITAALERQALEAQLQVIVAQRANELRNAELELDVTLAELEVAEAEAKAALAEEFLRAGLLADSPEYLNLLISEAWAAAYNRTDKVFVPVGTSPLTVINPDGADVVLPVGDGGQ